MDDHDRSVEETRAKIWTDIQKYGFSALGVMGDQSSPQFTYTVGLYPNTMPELILFGLRPDQATTLFHLIVKQKTEGILFESGKAYENIAQQYPLSFHQVDRKHYDTTVLAAIRWHNNTREFPLYQIVWPDTAGRFPWQTGFEERFMKDQPLLLSMQAIDQHRDTYSPIVSHFYFCFWMSCHCSCMFAVVSTAYSTEFIRL